MRPLPARVVDLSLLAGVTLALATGLASWLAARPGDAWVIVLHGLAGFALALFLALKLRRVAARVARTPPGVWLSVTLAALTVGALLTGVWWALGGDLALGPWGLLNLHVGLGLVVVPVLLWHLRGRIHAPRGIERRDALTYGAVLVGGALAWRVGQAVSADRRFTGSKEEGSDAGNAFPVTSWVADAPAPVDPSGWRLRVRGLVDSETDLAYGDVAPDATERTILDCTSGWYSDHDWHGVRVGDLLESLGVEEGAAWVQFRSVTGYRWSLPIAEARAALLATHVDGERLTHGHGFPLRLVAPDRRGFQWVKWVEEVRVTRRRDRSETLAIFVSGLG
jgi:uncharacterized membrane protein